MFWSLDTLAAPRFTRSRSSPLRHWAAARMTGQFREAPYYVDLNSNKITASNLSDSFYGYICQMSIEHLGCLHVPRRKGVRISAVNNIEPTSTSSMPAHRSKFVFGVPPSKSTRCCLSMHVAIRLDLLLRQNVSRPWDSNPQEVGFVVVYAPPLDLRRIPSRQSTIFLSQAVVHLCERSNKQVTVS
jgi:hypothetical protein